MSRNESRRQKQLAKKKAKRTEKRTLIAKQNSDNPVIRLAGAERWPIVAALVPEQLGETGIGNLVLTRRCPDGRLAMAVFLVDTYCLGAKNAFWRILSDWEYEKFLRQVSTRGKMKSVTPEFLTKLVYDAVAYAESFGFPPHPDYRPARMLLAGIDPALCAETFTFGKDGKPFYIDGPNDSPEKIRVIMHRVNLAGGHFVVNASRLEELDGLIEPAKLDPAAMDEQAN
ncbi:MAG: hypothetical protein HYX68_00965 [Planctomycetes bacterium]|nr:hypothetical protein [Planctomycetota bacterium]